MRWQFPYCLIFRQYYLRFDSSIRCFIFRFHSGTCIFIMFWGVFRKMSWYCHDILMILSFQLHALDILTQSLHCRWFTDRLLLNSALTSSLTGWLSQNESVVFFVQGLNVSGYLHSLSLRRCQNTTKNNKNKKNNNNTIRQNEPKHKTNNKRKTLGKKRNNKPWRVLQWPKMGYLLIVYLVIYSCTIYSISHNSWGRLQLFQPNLLAISLSLRIHGQG